LNRLDEAEAANLRAVELDPESLAALYALGRARLGVGKLDLAKSVFEKARALHPNSVRPVLELARVERFKSADDPRLAALESFLGIENSLNLTERTDLHFSLGRIYDEIGQYDRAFEHFVVGNRLQRGNAPDTESEDVKWFARTKEAYTRELFINRS